jgi:hypothetical protein
MKKLLSILGAIGIVASSSTAVASCGAKPANNGDDDIVDPTIKSALTSTGDLSKMLIVSKTENIGNNVGDLLTGKNNSLFQLKLDNFAQYSPTMLSRIKSANSYLSDDPIRKTEASDFAMWSDNFSSLFADEKNGLNGTGLPALDLSDAIESSSLLSKGDEFGTGNLDYLLSNSAIGAKTGVNSADAKTNVYNYLDDNLNEENNVSSITKTNRAMASAIGSNSAADVFLNPTADKLPAVLTLMGNLLQFTGTKGGVSDADDSSHGTGNLRGMYFGSGGFDKLKATTIDGKSQIGIIPSIFEKAYNLIRSNKDKINSDVYEYLVGTNDSEAIEVDGVSVYSLITDVWNNNTQSDTALNKAGTLTFDKEGNRTNYFWKATPNSGLFGDVISQMGSLLGHSDQNYKLDASKREGLMNEQGYKSSGEPILMDPDFYELQEKTLELFSATTNLLDKDLTKTIFSTLYSELKSVIGLASAFGINANEENIQELIQIIMDIMGNLLDFKGQSTNLSTVDAVKNEYSEGNFGLDTIQKLTDAFPLLSKEAADENEKGNPDWFNDKNAAYREAVYAAFGVENGTKITEGGFWDNFRKTTLKYASSSVFDVEGIVTADEWLYNTYDKNIFDTKVWNAQDVNVQYNDYNAISQITYTLEYKGLGNDAVAEFKTTDEVKALSQNDIYQKLTNRTDENIDFIKSYLGDGDLTKYNNSVDRKYTVTWVNDSQDPSSYDFKLVDLSNAQAYINGSWKEFNY